MAQAIDRSHYSSTDSLTSLDPQDPLFFGSTDMILIPISILCPACRCRSRAVIAHNEDSDTVSEQQPFIIGSPEGPSCQSSSIFGASQGADDISVIEETSEGIDWQAVERSIVFIEETIEGVASQASQRSICIIEDEDSEEGVASPAIEQSMCILEEPSEGVEQQVVEHQQSSSSESFKPVVEQALVVYRGLSPDEGELQHVASASPEDFDPMSLIPQHIKDSTKRLLNNLILSIPVGPETQLQSNQRVARVLREFRTRPQ